MGFRLRPEFWMYAILQALLIVFLCGTILAYGGPARAVVYVLVVSAAAIVVADRAFATERPLLGVAAYLTFATAAAAAALPIVFRVTPAMLSRAEGLTPFERTIAGSLVVFFGMLAGAAVWVWGRRAFARLPQGWRTPLWGEHQPPDGVLRSIHSGKRKRPMGRGAL